MAAAGGSRELPEERMRALQNGFQAHLSKPIDPVELMAAAATLARSTKQ